LRTALALAAALAGIDVNAATLRVAVDILPPSLANPYRTAMPPTIWSTYALFDGLTRFDRQGRVVPALAVGWSKIDDVTWRFSLREGVMFHNGTPFTADAVAEAVTYNASDAAAREGLKREVGILKAARMVDRLTVDIVTSEPAPQMPRYATAIMPAEPGQWRALGRDGFARAPVGTGPFRAARMDESVWKLEAFPQSWRAPKLAAIELLAVPETSARVAGLLAGRIDVALSVGPDAVHAAEAGGGLGYVSHDPSVFGLSFILGRSGPLDDVRVRRALNMAVDRERLIAGLLDGATVPASQPAPRTVLGHDPDVPSYVFDPAGARRLLAEAGYAQGFSFVLEGAVGIDANDAAIFQQVQSDLQKIGVTMTIRTMPPTQYFNALGQTAFTGDAFPVDWPSWPIVDVTRALLPHSCFRPVPWFCDPSVTPRLVAARTEWDEGKALALRQDLMRHYHDQAPALFLYETVNFAAVASRVRNFTMINGSHIPYDEITLAL
jgi:peptide/nickel transport system substrate-binding protein